ncbi:hypothetical protein H4W26_001809 [Nesterenkonia halotolerans]|uniref:Uncharacterized protein n=1 Tax=Nesterenkonia halotolerans TaxID=225325 RepID=A0ABR9J882_9MICC|nr:hypothetical protein [Nesterenkonia halotolerans]
MPVPSSDGRELELHEAAVQLNADGPERSPA